jgi:hypothetical protein
VGGGGRGVNPLVEVTLLTGRKTLKSVVPITVHPRIRPLESDLSCYKCTANIVFNGGLEPDENVKSTHTNKDSNEW